MLPISKPVPRQRHVGQVSQQDRVEASQKQKQAADVSQVGYIKVAILVAVIVFGCIKLASQLQSGNRSLHSLRQKNRVGQIYLNSGILQENRETNFIKRQNEIQIDDKLNQKVNAEKIVNVQALSDGQEVASEIFQSQRTENIIEHDCVNYMSKVQPINSILSQSQPVFIAGAMKSGTTLLFDSLTLHEQYVGLTCDPNIRPWSLRANKETHMLSRSILTQEAYQAYVTQFDISIQNSTYFQKTGKADVFTLDATPDYMLMPFVAPRIKRLLPQSKVIFMLRDPVERVISQYKTMYDTGLQYGFFNTSQPAPPLVSAIAREAMWLSKRNCLFGLDVNTDGFTWSQFNFKPGCSMGPQKVVESEVPSWEQCLGCIQNDAKHLFSTCFGEELYNSLPNDQSCDMAFYLSRGLYRPMIANYLKYFQVSNLLVIQFQDITDNRMATVNKVSKFLGSNTKFSDNELNKKNFMGHMIKQETTDRLLKAKDEINKAYSIMQKAYLKPNQDLYKLLQHMGVQDFKPFKSDKIAMESETT